MQSAVVIPILAIFVAAIAAPQLHRWLGDRLGKLLALVPLAGFVFYATLIPAVADGASIRVVIPWADSLGISLSFFVDGLSLLFLLIISGIGAFIVWYAAGYLHGSRNLGKFYLYLLSFMAAMLGIVASDNIILLFIFWELTSITSFLLIGYYNEQAESRRSALQALLVTGGGGLAMLAGLILLGVQAGTFEISALLAMDPAAIVEAPGFTTILVLILLGAFTKSAQFPFHFWLPNAMAAPAPVSAFLHSATMVKAGVFLLARLHPVLSEHALWVPIVAPVGAFTMLTGVFLGMRQTDLKKILAYTTLAVLGTLTMLLGLGTEMAVEACIVYLLAHALYKAALFMTAGTVDHETGTREIGEVSGLRHAMPFTATGAVLGALSMAGVPLVIGFISKEYFYGALLDAEGPPFLWISLGMAASMVMVALAAIAGFRPYFGVVKKTPKHAHEGPWTMWIGSVVLGLLALKFGIFPGLLGDHVITPAAAAVMGNVEFRSHLVLWHGINTALILSMLTLAVGAAIYFAAPRWRQISAAGYRALAAVGPEQIYFKIIDGVLAFATWQTSVLQNGRLRNYILTVGGFASLLLLWLVPRNLFALDLDAMIPPSLMGVSICVLMAASAIFACFAKSRFTAILALGVLGLGVAMLFFVFSAPDLAMTQILVETLTVVLFVLAFYKLPTMRNFSSNRIKVRDTILAGGFGILMTFLVLVAFHFESVNPPISEYMGENSYPLAHGRNVVNVILVDFRALDTLGEITVLAIAALGILAMLKLRSKPAEKPPQS